MKFTQRGKKVDKQIGKYLEVIIEVILNELSGIESILLGGGYGRGEGSVFLEGGKVIPQNDFELFLITNKPIKEELINRAANKAIRKINISSPGVDFYNFKREAYANNFYIDMKAIPISKLPFLLPMFRYFELKKASHLLWGKDYRHLIPDYKIKDFPLTEGLRLLLNRMALLCLYFSFDFLKKMSFAEKHGLMYLGSKAFTDLGGALTQLNSSYKPSYLGRMSILKKTFKKDFSDLSARFPEIPKVVEEGTNFKLKPDFNVKIDPYELWTRQKKYIREVLIYFSNFYFKKEFKDVFQVADFLYEEGYKYYYFPYISYLFRKRLGFELKILKINRILIFVLNFMYFVRLLFCKKKFYLRVLFNKRAPDLTMFASMIYILYGVEGKRKIDSAKMNKARWYLGKTYPLTETKGKESLGQWEQLKQDFSNSFLLFSLLKIV